MLPKKFEILTPKDVKEAERRQQDLQAMDAMKTEEQRQSVRFAAVINDCCSSAEAAVKKFLKKIRSRISHIIYVYVQPRY